jgi:divalent metal cation (Fe/Co/Zn/Cd) transporter
MKKFSLVLVCLMMLLAGFGVGINVGSQLFTERPDFITSIILGVVVIGCIIIPFVRKKEKG